MEFRHLGRSGLLVSEISYGNWITHGSQVEEDAAVACVRAALDEGITTFDTADVYAGTRAEEVLGRALPGRAPRGAGDLHQGLLADRAGPNDRGLSRKHIMESIDGSLRRLQTDYVDLYQAHRYDYSTPLEETMQAFADVVHSGKALYIGVSEWTADADRARRTALARELQHPAGLQPAAVLDAVAGHRGRGGPGQRGAGHRADRLVADRAGRAHRQVPAGPAAAGRLPRDRREVRARASSPGSCSDDVLTRVQQLKPLAEQAGLSMAQLAVAWVLQNPNVSSAIIGASRPGAGARQRQGGRA